MKRILNISIAILFCCYCFAQTDKKIFVADSATKEPVEYACIVFIDSEGGTYSNENGFFYIPQNIKQIELSSIGYSTKIIDVNKNIDTVFLSPQVYEISEAKVLPTKKKIKPVELGYANEKSNSGMGYLSGDEIAVYIPLDNIENSYRKIKQVILKGEKYLVRKLNPDKIDFISVFKINFYKATENKEIGEIINTEDIVFTSEVLKSKTKLDVSKYNIYMPENGIFVAIEFVGIINSKTGNFAILSDKNLLYPVGKTNCKTGLTRMKSRTGSLPFVHVTYKISNSIVYEKRKFKNAGSWQKVDKDYDVVKWAKQSYKDLKEDDFYTPLFSIVLE